MSRAAVLTSNHAASRVAAILQIRPAQPSDLAPLGFFFDTALRRDYFLRRGQLAEMLRGDRHRVLVAEVDCVLVGVAVLTRGARLVNLLVHPAYRGLGVGKALLEAAGPAEVRVKTDVSPGDPTDFYRRRGFQRSGLGNRKGNIEIWSAGAALQSAAPPALQGSTACPTPT